MASEQPALYVVCYIPLASPKGPIAPDVTAQVGALQQLLLRETVDQRVRVVSTSKSGPIRTARLLASGYFGFNPEADVITGKRAFGKTNRVHQGLAITTEALLRESTANVVVLVTGEKGIHEIMKAHQERQPPPIPRGSCWHIDTSGRGQHRQLTLSQPALTT